MRSIVISETIQSLLEVADHPTVNPSSMWLGFTFTEESVRLLSDVAFRLYIGQEISTPDDMHMTFRYFPNVEQDVEVGDIVYLAKHKLDLSLLQKSYRLTPFRYEVFGKDNCFVARYTSDALQSVRSIWDDLLEAEGMNYEETYPEYKPHITLGKQFEGPVVTKQNEILPVVNEIPPVIELKELFVKRGNLVVDRIWKRSLF